MKSKPFAITLDVGSSLLNKTGSWRTERPVYLDRLPPCNNACPAGENIQHWLFLSEEGRYEEAWRQIMEDNPFPAVMGRVCYMPCEGACNRGHLDESVGINSVERFLGDQGLMYQWTVEPGQDTGQEGHDHRGRTRRAGRGLSPAPHGAPGHRFEADAKPGGLIRYGIPKYRMPREKLNGEIRRIEEMGVEIRCNARIDDISKARDEGGFDAVILALGAPVPRRATVPQEGEDVVRAGRPGRAARGRARRAHRHARTRGGPRRRQHRHGRGPQRGASGLPGGDRAGAAGQIRHDRTPDGDPRGRRGGRRHQAPAGHPEDRRQDPAPGEEPHRRGPPPVATGEIETMEADVVVQAMGQVVEADLLSKVPGLEIRDGVA